jgi:hypothetical protein
MYQYNQMIEVPDTSGSHLLIGGPFAQILSPLSAKSFRCTLAKMSQELESFRNNRDFLSTLRGHAAAPVILHHPILPSCHRKGERAGHARSS